MLILPDMHTSWNGFFNDSIRYELARIEREIGTDYTPSQKDVLRFSKLDLNNIKVVILGQDPYKPEGVANGRAFQPNGLVNWSQTFRQVSLKNILRAIYATYYNITDYDLIPSYKDVVNKIEHGKFNIKQPVEWFDSLENQGVLFLNTSLTCKIGESNSHKEIWRHFSYECIYYISARCKNLDWFLWGKEAQQYETRIANRHRIFESRHPMMCSKSYEDDFLKSKCFRYTKDKINWLG